jgi:hypothetical protein
MKGYIYRLHQGADPVKGWIFNDPIFGSPPTLGACVPNLRSSVERGDWVFCISGRVATHQPFVVGGFQVERKITALQAYRRFPQYRLQRSPGGQVLGNIIVDGSGGHHPLDNHDGFQKRVQNYLVGGKTVHVQTEEQIQRAREQTLGTLSRVFQRPGNRSFDIVPRWRRMDERQVEDLRTWLESLVE